MRIDPLLTNYPIRIRQVTLGVFVGISSIFYVFPRALGEAEKTAYIIKDELETFDIPQTEQIEIPEPPAKPSVPIASEDDFLDEDYDIFDTDFDDWGDWEAPPADDGGNVEFVAFDKAPKAIITIQENVEYPDIEKSMLDELFLVTLPAHLQQLAGEKLSGEERDGHRAVFLRERLRGTKGLQLSE